LDRQLDDLAKSLASRLEWTKARTLAGVAGQVLQLREVFFETAWDEGAPEFRSGFADKFNRLHSLAIDALLEIGGLEAAAIGVGHFRSVIAAEVQREAMGFSPG